MSTTTILDSYDTQMLDYSGDIDVPMHGSAEPWFQTEAPMEDDGQIITRTHLSDHESVEVDMERSYEGEYAEYEMADEEVGIHPGESTELVDIDVYDASHAPTPSLVPVDLSSIPPSSVVPDTSVSQQEVFTDPITSLQPLAHHSLDHLVHEDPHSEPTADYSHDLPKSVIDPTTIVPPHLDLNLTVVGGPNADPVIGGADADHLATASYLAHPNITVLSETVEVVDYLNSSAEGGDEVQATTDSEHHLLNEEDGEHIDTPDAGQILPIPRSPEHVVAASEDAAPENDADPHEISEGVYIDPPPAVLLSLSFSSSEFCLFNQPFSRSNSPAAEGSERQILPLLLHQRPTLYYEPLVKVFEALRQDDYIGHLPEVFEGELVLDAYDLQLVVSEDNIYAREITLHDLNVIHDGSDFSGPLRIQLQSVIPRFITRYHLLQDQIARLNLLAETGEEDGEEEKEYGPETPHITNEEKPEAHHSEERHEQAEERGPEDDLHERYQEHDPLDREEHQDQHLATQEHHVDDVDSTGDPLIAGTVDLQNHQVGTRDTHEDDIEHAGAGTENSGHILDSEGVLEGVNTDASVGNEYTEYDEYTEPPEDNDDLYVQASVNASEETSVEIEDVDQETVSEHGQVGEDRTDIDNDQDSQSYQEDFEGHTQAELDHDSTGTVSGDGASPETNVVDELVPPNLVASHTLDHDPSDASNPTQPPSEDVTTLAYPEIFDDDAWDDSLDGEGEPDTWTAEDHDADSNQSSVTLSSKTSSKRNHAEFDEDDPDHGSESITETSPGSKRPRVL